MLMDFRVAIRAYLRQPGFTIVVLLTLGLGIGANTAMFSLVNAVLLEPLPYARPDRLVHLWETQRTDPSLRQASSYPTFMELRSQRDVFAALEGYDGTNVTVSDATGAEMVQGTRVTSGFFAMLGTAPVRGRSFELADDIPNGTNAVILSHGFWLRRFAGDPSIVGKTVSIDGVPYSIRGVLPESFRFGESDVWLPLGRNEETRGQRFNHFVRVVGRLRDGVTLEQASRRTSDMMRALGTEYAATNGGLDVVVTPLHETIQGSGARPLLVLFGAVAIVLLISCANVANLVLARTIERSRELAVRSAIGASRARVVRQLVTENLVLALGGALLGAAMAVAAVQVIVSSLPARMFGQMPLLRDASVDVRALVFTIAVAVLTGVLFGLAPAILTARRSAADLLRADARAGTGKGRYRVRDALVATEIALTLILLLGAALMGRSVLALLDVNPGFSAERVAIVRVPLAGPAYESNDRRTQFFDELVRRVRALPGVEAVGAISSAPLQGGGTNTYRVDGSPDVRASERLAATTRAVAGEYFQALRIPVIDGRPVGPQDDLRSPYAVAISQSLARRVFGDRRAVGQRIRFYHWQDSAWTIVGVVGDVATDRLDEPGQPTIYYYHLQGPANRMSIMARGTNADAGALIAAMRREVRAMDLSIPVYSVETMVDRLARSPAVDTRRFVLVMLGAFAVAALLLAVVGLYGIIAYAVTQRTRELAIRIALGAETVDVLALVLRGGLRLVAIGIAVGVVAATGLTRGLSSLLFGVPAFEPWTYVAVAALLAVVAVIASYVPARRATRVDPAGVLRAD
jgi:putative ABC transport system permease protein